VRLKTTLRYPLFKVSTEENKDPKHFPNSTIRVIGISIIVLSGGGFVAAFYERRGV
jgi:hypothetical protein